MALDRDEARAERKRTVIGLFGGLTGDRSEEVNLFSGHSDAIPFPSVIPCRPCSWNFPPLAPFSKGALRGDRGSSNRCPSGILKSAGSIVRVTVKLKVNGVLLVALLMRNDSHLEREQFSR